MDKSTCIPKNIFSVINGLLWPPESPFNTIRKWYPTKCPNFGRENFATKIIILHQLSSLTVSKSVFS